MKGNFIQLSVDQLMAKSRELAGVDIVDEEIVEPLSIIHRALDEEAQLDEEGAKAHTNKLLRLLTNRLRMKRDFLHHPEIRDQKIKGPLVIMGMPRTGTTKTQKVLAYSGDFNWLSYWESFNWASISGEPNENTETRIAEADEYCRWIDSRSPDAKLAHSFEALEPEEDTVLSEGSFTTISFLGYANIPSYARWVMGQPPSIMFEFMHDVLKYLQWQGLADPNKTWLLKSPAYNGLELEILKVFPDAKLVTTHRSPLKTLPSLYKFKSSLLKAFTGVDRTQEPNSQSAAIAVEAISQGIKQSQLLRQENPNLPVIDLRFEAITTDFPRVAEKIYAHAGLELTEKSLQRMREWEEENAMHKYGSFKYSLEEFALSEELVREKMSDYFKLLDSLEKKAQG